MRELFKQLNLLFLVLLAGQLFFCLTVVFLNSGPDYAARKGRETELFSTLIPVFILSMTFAIHLIDKQRQKKGIRLSNVREKFRFYRNSVFLRLILMESTNVFAIVIALVEGRLYYTIYFLIGLMAFFYFRPSIHQFMEAYNLSEEEKTRILES